MKQFFCEWLSVQLGSWRALQNANEHADYKMHRKHFNCWKSSTHHSDVLKDLNVH